jgi:hypothetical protein
MGLSHFPADSFASVEDSTAVLFGTSRECCRCLRGKAAGMDQSNVSVSVKSISLFCLLQCCFFFFSCRRVYVIETNKVKYDNIVIKI